MDAGVDVTDGWHLSVQTDALVERVKKAPFSLWKQSLLCVIDHSS
jgi:hypothetical protein